MFRFIVVAVTMLLISGCTLFENLPDIGDPRVTGTVVYHDTGIGLQSEVRFGSRKAAANHDGKFSIRLPKGAHEWTASTMVGNRTGSIFVSSAAVLTINIPAFPGWSRHDFNELVVFSPAGASIRWEVGKPVRFWIEDNPRVTESQRRLAIDALREWEGVLGQAITFQQVSSPGSANLTIRWTEASSIDASGVCKVTWDPSKYIISKGEIEMSYGSASNIGMYRHEVGHCIGLDHHRTNSNYVMYPEVSARNQSIAPEERRLAQLLYAARPGLRTLSLASAAAELETELQIMSPEVTHNDDGTVTATIYTWEVD